MATRSRIAYLDKKGNFLSVYCHWDGYPEGVGATLFEHYNTHDRVLSLLSGGDISSLRQFLNPDPSEVHSFENPQDHVTLYYHRDRGDELYIHQTPFLSFHSGEEFVYIFDAHSAKWVYQSVNEYTIIRAGLPRNPGLTELNFS